MKFLADPGKARGCSTNPEWHHNPISGSKATGRFCLLVELHREGSAPAACAAGLFLKGHALIMLGNLRVEDTMKASAQNLGTIGSQVRAEEDRNKK